MKKFFDLLLIFLVTLLIANYFLPKPPSTNTILPAGIILSAKTPTVTIPNFPEISILNNTTNTGVTIDTCRDIAISINGQKIEKDIPTWFCQHITLNPNEKKALEISALSPILWKSWDITFAFAQGSLRSEVTVKIEEKGVINALFSHVFFAPVYNLFIFLLSFLPNHSLGLAIILLTIIIRLILLVPQHHMLMSTRKLQAIQPKIKEIQDKHAEDRSKLGMELMELYKKEKVNPFGSCLPLLIQMPILIVLYKVIFGVTTVADTYYLYALFGQFNISTITTNFFGLNLLGVGGIAGITLALLIGSSQWIQMKLAQPPEQPKKDETKPKKDNLASAMPDPQMMQKMMLWMMPPMIAVSAYFFPAGIGIYWLVGTLFMIIQQKIVNKLTSTKKPLVS